MQPHKPLVESLMPFLTPSSEHSVELLRTCHSTVLPDVELRDFVSSYRDFIRNAAYKDKDIRSLLLMAKCKPEWETLAVGFARVIAATPHSCDVERLISSYNLLKTVDRSFLAPETLNDYLHVNLNMPPLAEFNVWPAVQLFLAEKARREIVQVPSKSSKWFKGVFSEATEEKVTVPKCRVKF